MVEDKEQRIETLQDRVDELEATVSKMLPSRRDALKLGAAGAVGAVGMAGSASAQNSNQVGTIGTDSDRVDVNAEDIDAVSVNTSNIRNSLDSFSDVTEGNASFTGLNPKENTVYRLFLRGRSEDGGTNSLFMTVNGNNTDLYETIHTDGTSNNFTDGFEIYRSTASSAHFGAVLTIQQAGNSRVVVNGPVGAGQYGRVERTLETGGLDQSEFTISSIEFDSTSSETNVYDLYGTISRFDYE